MASRWRWWAAGDRWAGGPGTGAADAFLEQRGIAPPFILPKDPSKQRWSLGFKGPNPLPLIPSDFNSPWRSGRGSFPLLLVLAWPARCSVTSGKTLLPGPQFPYPFSDIPYLKIPLTPIFPYSKAGSLLPPYTPEPFLIITTAPYCEPDVVLHSYLHDLI